MKFRLLESLIQDVPDEISICEFECRRSICTADDPAKCELHQHTAELLQQTSLDKRAAYRSIDSSRTRKPDSPGKWQSVWLYEVKPLLYLLSGFAVIYHFESLIGYGVGGLLSIAAIRVWVMRFRSRASLLRDNVNFTRNTDR